MLATVQQLLNHPHPYRGAARRPSTRALCPDLPVKLDAPDLPRTQATRDETQKSHAVGRRFTWANHDVDMQITDLRVVAVDHPSLDRDVERFLDDLRRESRFFGPTTHTNPKPFPSLIQLLERRTGFRLGVVECNRLIGLARVDRAGQVFIAIAADRRGTGVGTLLGTALVERAIQLGHHRLSGHTTARSMAANQIAASLGCTIVAGEGGRTDLIVDLRAQARSA